jgi:broad specificity phosphatase PhoE
MKKACLYILVLLTLTSCSRTYYIVRHAEKAAPDASMSSDVPLSDAGRARALALKEKLNNKNISTIYSTNFIRTKTTAEPLSSALKVPIGIYGPMPDSAFMRKLREGKGNVLIVGHSNTVDDVVNMLTGVKKLNDLEDSVYNNLFVVKMNRNGKVIKTEQLTYGK